MLLKFNLLTSETTAGDEISRHESIQNNQVSNPSENYQEAQSNLISQEILNISSDFIPTNALISQYDLNDDSTNMPPVLSIINYDNHDVSNLNVSINDDDTEKNSIKSKNIDMNCSVSFTFESNNDLKSENKTIVHESPSDLSFSLESHILTMIKSNSSMSSIKLNKEIVKNDRMRKSLCNDISSISNILTNKYNRNKIEIIKSITILHNT